MIYTIHETVAKEIAQRMGVTWEAILGDCRRSIIADARHAICGILSKYGMRWTELAVLLKYDCHTTAMYGAARYRSLPESKRIPFECSIESLPELINLFECGARKIINKRMPRNGIDLDMIDLPHRARMKARSKRRYKQRKPSPSGSVMWDSMGDSNPPTRKRRAAA